MNARARRSLVSISLGGLLAGCGSGTGTTGADMAPADTCMSGSEKGVVMTQLKFVKQDKPGVSLGFDIDHHVATSGDPLTCGHASLKGPDGTLGIDNQLSQLLPALPMATQMAVDSDLQDAINQGMLLNGFRLLHVDSLVDDPCVTVEVRHLSGKPTVGTDHILDANQTFDSVAGDAVSTVNGQIKAGVLTAGPFELQLPVKILDANFTMPVHTAYLSLTLAADGSLSGVLGGTIEAKRTSDTLTMYAIGEPLRTQLPGLLAAQADQVYDATTMTCRDLSVAMQVWGKAAFINP